MRARCMRARLLLWGAFVCWLCTRAIGHMALAPASHRTARPRRLFSWDQVLAWAGPESSADSGRKVLMRRQRYPVIPYRN